jgi:hypothetical protein
MSLSSDDMIANIENPKISTKKILEIISNFSKLQATSKHTKTSSVPIS